MAKHSQSPLALLFLGAAIISYCSAETAAGATGPPLPATTVVCATPAIPYVYAKAEDIPGRTTEIEELQTEWFETSLNSSWSFDQFVGNFTGFDVELLKAFASTVLKNTTIRVRLMPTYPGNLYEVRTGGCDIAVGGLIESFDRQNGCECAFAEEGAFPREENVCCLTFLEYYHRDGVAVMVPAERRRSVLQHVWDNVTSEEMVVLFSSVALILFVLGHLIWFVETRRNGPESDFAESYSQGISDGLWWGAVTMTTVGYGDFVPRSLCGRVIGFFWMLAGVAVSGVLIGLITESFSGNSTFILANIERADQIQDLRICTVPGFFEEFAAGIDLAHELILKKTIDECWESMSEADNSQVKTEAVLHDHLGILSDIKHIQKHRNPFKALGAVEISGILQSTYNSIAVKHGNPLGPLLNAELLSLLGPRRVVFGKGGDFSDGLYGWKITDAKERYFHYSTQDEGYTSEVFELNSKDDGGYSVQALGILSVTFGLYAAEMLYLTLSAFLSKNKKDRGSRDDKLPVATVETGNPLKAASDPESATTCSVNSSADLESLQSTVADMAKAMSKFTSEISELKQLLSDAKK